MSVTLNTLQEEVVGILKCGMRKSEALGYEIEWYDEEGGIGDGGWETAYFPELRILFSFDEKATLQWIGIERDDGTIDPCNRKRMLMAYVSEFM